jgi:predicted O-methyltransferase YrrM
MESSYAVNNYGELFEGIVRVEQPSSIVEFGILEGYSTSCFLRGLIANGKGTLRGYDWFEACP